MPVSPATAPVSPSSAPPGAPIPSTEASRS
jgi:hypothetical protein